MDEQLGVGLRDVLVVVQDRDHVEDVIQERLTTGASLVIRQQDADSQFRHRDRRYGDVVVILDRVVKGVAGSLGVDEIRRVEEERPQGRSSS